jgi:hypothetical protein
MVGTHLIENLASRVCLGLGGVLLREPVESVDEVAQTLLDVLLKQVCRPVGMLVFTQSWLPRNYVYKTVNVRQIF